MATGMQQMCMSSRLELIVAVKSYSFRCFGEGDVWYLLMDSGELQATLFLGTRIQSLFLKNRYLPPSVNGHGFLAKS